LQELNNTLRWAGLSTLKPGGLLRAIAHRVTTGQLSKAEGYELLVSVRISAMLALQGVKVERYFETMIKRYSRTDTKKVHKVPKAPVLPSQTSPPDFDETPEYVEALYQLHLRDLGQTARKPGQGKRGPGRLKHWMDQELKRSKTALWWADL